MSTRFSAESHTRLWEHLNALDDDIAALQAPEPVSKAGAVAVLSSNSGAQSANAFWRFAGYTVEHDSGDVLAASTGLFTLPTRGWWRLIAGGQFSNSGTSARRVLAWESGAGSAGAGVELGRVESQFTNRWSPNLVIDRVLEAGTVVAAITTSSATFEVRGGDYHCWASVELVQDLT